MLDELRAEGEMAEAVVNLVFLGLVLLAVIACVLGPVAAVGFILWHWHKKSIEMGRSRKKVVYGDLRWV